MPRWKLLFWGCALLVVTGCGAARERAKDLVRIQKAADLVRAEYNETSQLPDDAAGQKLIDEKEEIAGRIRYKRIDDANFEIQSAGPDAKFGTGDDRTVTLPANKAG